MMKKWFSIAVIALILAVVAVTQLPAPAYAQTQGQCWALIIGVADYQNPVIDDVPRAGYDNLYQKLAGFWGEDHVTYLLDDDASKQNIKNQIQGWLDSSENAQDTVLVFLAGHGDYGLYLPWDVYSTSGCVSDTELSSWLGCLESNKQIIILETCHSGSFIYSLTRNGRIILTSSAADEYSIYDLIDGPYFTYYITSGFSELEEVDSDGNGEVSAEELFEYAGPKTTNWAAVWAEPQHPQIDDNYPDEAALLAKLTVLSEHGQTTGSGWYGIFRPVEISVSSDMVTINTGTRDVFTGWETFGVVNDTSRQTTIVVDAARTFTAVWQTQYRLAVRSAYGTPTWTEWHNANSEAPLSVNPIDDHHDGSRHVFTGWVDSSGTTVSTSAEAGVIMDSPQNISASWKEQFFLNIAGGPADPTPLSNQGWYDDGATVTTGTAPDIEMGGPGTRYVFQYWLVDGVEVAGNTIEITVNSPVEVSPSYETQYLLTVQSDYGQPSEGGWHPAGSAVPVSVTPVEGMLVRHIFTGWSGDVSETLPDFTVTMNGPRTVTANFRTDYLYLYILIGGVSAIAIAAAFLIWRKLRSRKAVPVMATAAPALPPIPAFKPITRERPAVAPPAPAPPIVTPPSPPIVTPPAPEKPAAIPPAPKAPAPRGRLAFPDNSEIALTEAVRTIGRDDLKKAVSPDAAKFISRQHFLIRHDAGRYFIEDLNTANGTKVNGVEITGKGIFELRDGDRINVATVLQLTFRTDFPI